MSLLRFAFCLAAITTFGQTIIATANATTPSAKPTVVASVTPAPLTATVETASVATAPATSDKASESSAPNAGENSNPLAAAVAAPKPAPPSITLMAKIDLTTQTASIAAHGKTIHTWKISSGTEEFATPRGMFRPEWMAKMWFSKKYDDAPMPHAVFFKDGAAMHATQATHALGRPASHGCVRLAPANATTFYGLVQKHGQAHTRIHVFGTPNYAPKVAQKAAPAPSQRNSAFAPQYRQAVSGPAYGYYQQPQKQTYLLDGLFGSSQPQPRPLPYQARMR